MKGANTHEVASKVLSMRERCFWPRSAPGEVRGAGEAERMGIDASCEELLEGRRQLREGQSQARLDRWCSKWLSLGLGKAPLVLCLLAVFTGSLRSLLLEGPKN